MIDRLFEKITATASEFPERIAIFENDKPRTYKQFENAIREAAALLQSYQLKPADRVGIYLDNSFDAYAYIYATMLVGCTYVPLSTVEPQNRLRTMIEHSGIRLLIGNNLSSLKFKPEVQLLDLTKRPSISLSVDHAKLHAAQASEDREVYLLYTSGTTGSPKGILISESNLMNFCDWAIAYFTIVEEDVFLGHIHLTFDLSVFHLFLPFLVGASVRITPPTLERIAPARQLEQGVTIAMLVPRMTGLLANAGFLNPGVFSKLRHLLFCGEKLFAQQIELWQKCQPDLTIHNLYGPTETTVACSCFTILPQIRPLDPIPIGRAITGMKLTIREDEKVGELLISGPQLSRFEYVDNHVSRPALRKTNVYASGDLAELDASDNFIWLSRLDDQIKIQGHRVELSEIEISLSRTGLVSEIVCAFDPSIEKIFAFYTSSNPTSDSDVEAGLHEVCLQSLPGYMHPQSFHRVDVIPLSKNGKTDRIALLRRKK